MRVLIVVHGFPPRATGGTELYAEAHARTLAAAGDTVMVIAREDDRARQEFSIRAERRDGFEIAWVNHTFRESTSLDDAWRSPRVARAIVPALERFAPDVAHVHHLTCLSTLIPSMLAARGVPVVATLHDYWLMCHRGQLIDLDGRRCDGPGESGCDRCLPPIPSVPSGVTATTARALGELQRAAPVLGRAFGHTLRAGASLLGTLEGARAASAARTRHVREEVIPHVDVFLAPCEHLRERFVRFGVPASRVRVSGYGIAEDGARQHRHEAMGPLRVGYVGSLMASKGPHIAMDAVARLPEGTATLDVYGAFAAYHGDRSYEETLTRAGAHPAVRQHGALDHARILEALSTLDVLVVPSTWEENQPFVVLEAFRAGLPVVASRIGGLPELIRHDENGLLVEPGDTAQLAAALQSLAEDRPRLARLTAALRPPRSLGNAVAEMREVYEELMSRGRSPGSGAPRPNESMSPIRSIAAVLLHYGTPEETAIAVRALRACEAPLDRVIVVDNDEQPGELDPGTVGLPVERLVTGRNLGFPGGMNAGIRRALAGGADAVLLVNSDVVVPPWTPSLLAGVLDEHPEAGIVGPVILAREAPDRIASLGIRFHQRSGRMRNIDAVTALAGVPRWRPVDAVNGAAFLVSRRVFDRVGVFEAEYFLSFEEIEFCMRARAAGFESGVTGAAVAYHRGGASLPSTSVPRFYYAARNHLRVAERAHPSGLLARTARATFIVALNLAHALTASGGARAGRVRATIRGVRDYARGRFGPESDTGSAERGRML